MSDTKQATLTDKDPEKLRVQREVREYLEGMLEEMEGRDFSDEKWGRKEIDAHNSRKKYLRQLIEEERTHVRVTGDDMTALKTLEGIHKISEIPMNVVEFADADHLNGVEFVDPFEDSGNLVAEML